MLTCALTRPSRLVLTIFATPDHAHGDQRRVRPPRPRPNGPKGAIRSGCPVARTVDHAAIAVDFTTGFSDLGPGRTQQFGHTFS